MKSRGRFLAKFLCLGLAAAISGCGLGSSSEGAGTTGQGGCEEAPSMSLAEKLADDQYFYREADRVVFRYEEPENMLHGGGWTSYMGSEGVGRYALFQLEGWEPEDDYSVIQLVNAEGEVTQTELSFARQGALFGKETAHSDFYPVIGRKEIVLTNYAYPEPSQIRIVDEMGEVKAGFSVPGEITQAYRDVFLVPGDVMIADADYNLYVAWDPMDEAGIRLLACDREGGKLWEELLEDPAPWEYFIQGMTALPDGRAGCVLWYLAGDEEGRCLAALDPEEGVQVLAKFTEKEIKGITYLVCYDEDTLLYATEKGLYRCDYQGRNTEELYLWLDNGIKIGMNHYIDSMQVRPDGDIDIFLCSEGEDIYLRLELATEKKEVLEVSFAVPQEHERLYQGAVADFNKAHGDCKISMVVYEEQAKLLTELAAGKGPALVDTSLVSFAGNEKLWECLDDSLAEWGLKDVLLENTLQGGQIGGKQYGLSFTWSLLTFASVSYQEESWDYEQFLKHLKNAEGLEMLFEYQSPEGFLREFLCRSPEESYLIDPEAGRAYFDTERFTNAVELANRLAGERDIADSSELAEQVRSGRCLGELVALADVEETAYYDAKFGEQINYVGLPGKEGSCHYICSDDPLAVRAGASEEEKNAALAFLKQLLGKDAQEELVRDFGLSVRRDVFSEQLENMREELVYIIDGAEVRIPVDKEKAKERMLSLYERAVPDPFMPEEIYQVLMEELSECFRGAKSVEEAAKVLQNRVQLYLDERKN